MRVMTTLVALGTLASAASAVVVNIDARVYGFAAPTDPAPVPGQIITPITSPNGLPLNQITLGPGTYRVTNAAATGAAGSNPNFTAYNWSGGWGWAFVMNNNATGAVVLYMEAGQVRGTQAQVANDPAVRNVTGTFTLTQTTTLNFMCRDFFLPDNAGGISIEILLAETCDDIDFNNNGVFPEDQDVIDFFNVLAGADCPTCNDIDFNNNSVFPEDQDVIDFFNVLAGGTC